MVQEYQRFPEDFGDHAGYGHSHIQGRKESGLIRACEEVDLIKTDAGTLKDILEDDEDVVGMEAGSNLGHDSAGGQMFFDLGNGIHEDELIIVEYGDGGIVA